MSEATLGAQDRTVDQPSSSVANRFSKFCGASQDARGLE